jgi:hypothetical protein
MQLLTALKEISVSLFKILEKQSCEYRLSVKRPHQSLSNLMIDEVYYSGIGDGSKIIDRFGREISSSEDNGAGIDSL